MKSIPVLAYHSFDCVRFPNNKLAIPPELFRRQLEWARFGGHVSIPLDVCAQKKGRMGFFENFFCLTFDDGYLDNYEQAYPLLRSMKLQGTFFITAEAVGGRGFMTWEMLKEMAATPGIEIASHGLFHRPLADISDHEAKSSIVDSKRLIEDKLGKKVRAFSYPSGSFTEKIVECVKEAGYEYACAASHVHDRKYLGNPFLIRRIKVSASSSSRTAFGCRLSGFYHLFGRP